MSLQITRRSVRRGFTLVELLIVLAILVMLMALVVPRFMGASKKAQLQTTQTQIGFLKGALERYAVDMGDYPLTEDGLQALLTAPAAGSSADGGTDSVTTTNWDGPYLNEDSLPKDAWGNQFQYVYPPERGRSSLPDIWSLGPDKEDNTEDDICSWTKSAEGTGEPGDAPREDRDIDIDANLPREPAPAPDPSFGP